MNQIVKKKKIIFILTILGPGGAEKVISSIANKIDRNIYEPKIILFNTILGHTEMLRDDVQIINLHTERIRESLVPILKVIKSEKPDIVFSGYGEVNAYISLFIKFFPKVKFIARETNVVSQHVTRKVIRFFYRFYNNYHQIVAQSDDMHKDLIQNIGVKPEKITKINNPVDFDIIKQKLENEVKPIEYSDENFKHVIAVGNLSSRKGFDLLLKVFSNLKNEKIKLHILGNGRDKELLLNLKNELNLENVHFHGQKKNPYPYLKFADLFILSSRYEGFPNVLLEAGACGTYALANNCLGGINEIIQPKINGEILAIEKSLDFANKIIFLLKNKPNSEKIILSIKNRFNEDIIFKEYENLLNKL